ncbi:MAG TPA: hypothetical protein VLY24_02950 [Bryobacteraceae bacterium]|nr:hypothetical protein [Bryobacteraceae bacterium]
MPMPLEALLRSLDDSVRIDLQHLHDQYFGLLLAATVIVAIGVAFEGPEIVRETRDVVTRFLTSRRDESTTAFWTGMPISEIEPQLNWRSLLSSFGWLLIVVGVGAEFVCDRLVSNVDALSQNFSTILFIAAQGQAATIQEEASYANERTLEISGLLKTQQETTSRFQRQATDSEFRLTKATADLTEAQRHIELDMRRRGSRVTLIQVAKISDDLRLKLFKGQQALIVSCLPPIAVNNGTPSRAFDEGLAALLGTGDTPIDSERNSTAGILGRELSKSHWNPTPPMPIPLFCSGIEIGVNPEADIRTQFAAQELAHVLHDALLLEEGPRVLTQRFEPPDFVVFNSVRSLVVFIGSNPFFQ